MIPCLKVASSGCPMPLCFLVRQNSTKKLIVHLFLTIFLDLNLYHPKFFLGSVPEFDIYIYIVFEPIVFSVRTSDVYTFMYCTHKSWLSSTQFVKHPQLDLCVTKPMSLPELLEVVVRV